LTNENQVSNQTKNIKQKTLELIDKVKSIDVERLKKKIKKYGPMKLWSVLRFLLLIGIGFILIYPILYMLSNAIRTLDSLTDPSVIWIPKEITFETFIAAFKALSYPKAVFTTLSIGVVSAIIQVFSTSFIGYGIARFNFRGKGILVFLVLLSILVPPQITVIPQSLNYRALGILNTPLTFYLPALFGTGIRAGLFIFIFMNFYRNMPKDLEDAAMVDGCKPLQTYIKIMMPNAIVIFVTVFLFSLVWYWNDYFVSSIFYSKNNTISVALVKIRTGLANTGYVNQGVDPNVIRNYLQAGSLLSIAPIMLVYMFFQKYFVESIERSGIVG
jgi:multiple sugar transport system permease protein